MKKSLRVLLFAALVLTLLIISAVAVAAAPFSTGDNTYATLPEAVAAVAEGGTITMTESATFSGDIVLSANKTYTITASSSSVTLTLSSGSLRISGGNVTISTLTLLAKANNALMVANQGTRVTVLSGTFVSEGTTTATAASATADYSAYLQIDGGTFTGAVGTYDSSAGSLGGISAAHTTIVINGGSFARAAKVTTGTAYVLRLARQYTDITVNGGTFVYDYTAGTEKSGHTVYFNTSTGSLTINGGSFTSKGLGGANVIDIQSGVLTINDGQFYALHSSAHAIKAYSSSPTVTINGGFFSFMDTLEKESDIDTTRSSTYANSEGYNCCYGVNFDCTGSLRITGGTFMGGNSYQALSIGTYATNVVVSGGSFYGHRAVSLYGRAVFTGGNFYHNPGQANAKTLDIRNANAVANIFGGNFDGTHVSAANISTGAVIYYEKAGTVNIYGGTFKLGGTNAATAMIGASTTNPVSGCKLTIASGSATVNSVSYTGAGATFLKTGKGYILRGNSSAMQATVNAGTFKTYDMATGFYLTADMTLDVKSGSFEAFDGSSMFNVSAKNAKLTFARRNSVTVTVHDTACGFMLSAGDTLIYTGTFVSGSSCLVNFVIAEGQGSFEIVDGTFILNESSTVKGGSLIRAGVGVIPQSDKGQYYDPTEIYTIASGEIVLSGGMFIDNRSSNAQLIDLTVGNATVRIDGAVLLSRDLQVYFVDANNEVSDDIRMNDKTPVVQYGGEDYYCYFADVAANTTYSPILNESVGVLISPYYDGIRFTSAIPAEIAAKLPEGATFGTLIAPANYVAAAGAFTHAKLNTYASKNPDFGTVYVDIPAVYSIVTLPDGSIAFSGALVNLKTENYDRALAAVAYVKVGSTYYYSNYDAADHTGSMAEVAKAAYTNYTLLPDEVHMTPSLYRANSFSAYDYEEQQTLKGYCGYEHTFDVATVTPSTNITVGADASATLATAAGVTLKNTLAGLGYSTTGATILVGNTEAAETAKALSEIEGDGYYIGAINGKIVIVGTTNALTMQALSIFNSEVLTDIESNGSIILSERVVSYVEMIALNSDTPFVFSWHRDGNIWQPYTGGGDKVYSTFKFMYNSTGHLYNKEGNEQYYVDYPVVAAILLGDVLDGSGLNYIYLPDHLAANKGTIQIGLTEYAMQTALIGRDAGYYGYTVKDGNVVITAFDDTTLRLAKKLFEDNLADFATADGYFIPVDFEFEKYGLDGLTGAFDSITGATGAGNVAEEVKKLVTDTTLCPRPQNMQLSGIVNVDSDALEYYYENAKFVDYYQYCRLLEANGFTVYMKERSAEQSFFVTYVNESTGIMLHVMFHAYAHAAEEALAEGTTLAKMFTPTLRVIAARTTHDKSYVHQLLDESMLRVPATGKLTQTKLTVMEVSFDLSNENKRNFGFCYVYTLEDGTFVVLDGGGGGHNSTDAERLYNLLTDLYTDTHGTAPTSSEPIVISAWFLSHGHGDHYGMMDYFINNYCNKKNFLSKTPVVRVDKLIANMPSNDEMYNSMDPNPTVPNMLDSTNWYSNHDGSYIQYYKVHTGQKFFIGNLEIEVMYTHEDIHPWGMIYYNNTSTVVRMTAHETDGNGNILVGKNAISNMNLGDLQVRGSQVLRAMWGDYLKSDMVLSSHHGGNGVEALTYYRIDAQIILWSHCANNVQSLMNESGTSAYAKQNILWLQNTRWLYIFTGQPLNETPNNKYQYNPTMTLTKDGVVGLPLNVAFGDKPLTEAELQSYADQFIAGLTNEYPGSSGSSFTWGTGQYNESATAKPNYTGGTNNNGMILWRGNASYQLPDPKPAPEEKTGEDVFEDIFGDGLVEF